jgi:hypothetical protein
MWLCAGAKKSKPVLCFLFVSQLGTAVLINKTVKIKIYSYEFLPKCYVKDSS